MGALANSLRKNRSLTKLQLRDTGVGERGCSELSKALPYHAALKELGLEDVPGLRLTLTLILTLTLTPLQELGLEDNSLPPRATETLLRAMRQSSSLSSISTTAVSSAENRPPPSPSSHLSFVAPLAALNASHSHHRHFHHHHAGDFSKPQTANAMMAKFTIAMLAGKKPNITKHSRAHGSTGAIPAHAQQQHGAEAVAPAHAPSLATVVGATASLPPRAVTTASA